MVEEDHSTSNPAQEPGEISDEEVDETLLESFPASDPPSWTLGTDHPSVPEPALEDRENKEGSATEDDK